MSIGKSNVGVLDHDLRRAALAALSIPRDLCRKHALQFSWRESARQFFGNVLSANGMGVLREAPKAAA